MDATAAAICCGLNTRGFRLRDGLVVGLWFGGFQTGMTWIGGLFGTLLSQRLWHLGSLLSFGLLAFLGLRMVAECLRPSQEEKGGTYDLRPVSMAALALATSLDALAAGISLTYLGEELTASALVIGLVTFALSLGGSLLGQKVGQRWSRPAGMTGGLVLVGLGIKILLG